MTNLGMSNGEFNAMLVQLDELPGRCVNPMCLQQVSYRGSSNLTGHLVGQAVARRC